MEVVSGVLEVFGKIYDLAETAKSNVSNCRKAAARCKSLSSIIDNCVKQYSRYGGMDEAQCGGFDMLLTHITQMHDLIAKYSKKNSRPTTL